MVVRGVIGSIVGGAIGALAWAALAYFAHIESAWLAIGVGFLAGLGMAVGAKDDTDMVTGVIAAVVALVSIAGGKYLAVEAMASKMTTTISQELNLTDADLRLFLAGQIAAEYESAGKTLKWPEGITSDADTTKIEDYPEDVRKDMEARWSAMTPAQIEEYRMQTTEYFKGVSSQVMSSVKSSAFTASFSWWDILFGLVAVGAAFKIGSGGEDGGE